MKSNTIQLTWVSNNNTMTGTTTITSNPIPLDQIFGYAIQAYWTGTPNGTLKLQASSDAPANQGQVSNGGPDQVTNWTDIANSSYTITGSAGNYMANYNGSFYRYVRMVYTNTSGSGTLNAELSVKGV